MAAASVTQRSGRSCVFCDVGEPKDGRFLHCLHVICVSCLQENTTPELGEGSIECHACKELTEQRFPNLELRKQLVRSNLQNQSEKKDNDEETVKLDNPLDDDGENLCDFCHGAGDVIRRATHLCSGCDGALLCEEHAEEHGKIRVFKQHDLKPLSTEGQGDSWTVASGHCPLHSQHRLWKACKTCHSAVCRECLASQHDQHDIIPISELANEQLANLRADLRQCGEPKSSLEVGEVCKSGLTAELEKMIDKLLEGTSAVNDEANVASQAIRDTIERMTKQLKETEKDLLTEVEALKQRQQQQLEERLRGLTGLEETRHMATELGKCLCDSQRTDADVIQLGDLIQRKLKWFRWRMAKEQRTMQRHSLVAATLSTAMGDLDAAVRSGVVVLEDLAIDLDKVTVNVPDSVNQGVRFDVMLIIPCSTDPAVAGRVCQDKMSVTLVAAGGTGTRVSAELSPGSTSSPCTIALCARMKPVEAGDHTLEVKLDGQGHTFPVHVHVPLKFDGQRSSSDMVVSGPNDTIAQLRANAKGIGNVYGSAAYTAGTHTWSIKVSGESLQRGMLCCGVATLPDGPVSTSHWLCTKLGTGWNSKGTSFSKHGAHHRDAQMGPWQDGDVLIFTLDCAAGTLQLHVERTGERRTITRLHSRCKPLYFCITAWEKQRRVEIL
eukprot:scpid51555/ scgid9891/ 